MSNLSLSSVVLSGRNRDLPACRQSASQSLTLSPLALSLPSNMTQNNQLT